MVVISGSAIFKIMLNGRLYPYLPKVFKSLFRLCSAYTLTATTF